MTADAQGSLQRYAPGVVAATEPGVPPSGVSGLGRPFGFPRSGSRNWVWAFVGQGFSSATSLGLSLLTGRALGVSALGVVVVGFGAYLLVLLLHRALVTTPLISSSSNLVEAERAVATSTALTVTLTIGVVGAGLLALLGAAAGGSIGQGLLAFAPWLVPALAQDLVRSSLFRDGRGGQAALTDVAWLGTMAVCAPFAVMIDEVWAVVGAWGIGSVVAALIGAAWIRAKPTSLSTSRTWFFRVAFPFGRWLALQEGLFAIASFGSIVLLTAILGAVGLGGLRAAEAIFAPMTLLAPALVLAGLPAVSRALARSQESAVNLAAAISGACVLLIIAYSGVMLIAGSRILTAVFGNAFEPYGSLVVPMSTWQLALAVGTGFTILLRGEQRGAALLVAGTSMTVIAVVASPALAELAGVQGAVWGLSAAAAVYSLLVVCFGLRGPRIKTAS